MPEGGQITISSSFSADKKSIAVRFADSGVGIPKENINKLFDPFFTTKSSGTGLGLAVTDLMMPGISGLDLLKELKEIRPGCLRFYVQDQVAGQGEAGVVFVLTFLDNRIFQTAVKGIADLALLGRTFYLAVPGRGLLGLSFERNEITEWPAGDIAGGSLPPGRHSAREKNLFIFSPGAKDCSVQALSGHGSETRDCLAMGPKIVTSGTDSGGRSSVRVWGSAFFVRTELGKLFIKP